MATKKTQTIMGQFNRLEEIRNELSGQKPDLDTLMPKFEETNKIEKELTEFFTKTKKVIEQKRKEQEQERNQ